MPILNVKLNVNCFSSNKLTTWSILPHHVYFYAFSRIFSFFLAHAISSNPAGPIPISPGYFYTYLTEPNLKHEKNRWKYVKKYSMW